MLYLYRSCPLSVVMETNGQFRPVHTHLPVGCPALRKWAGWLGRWLGGCPVNDVVTFFFFLMLFSLLLQVNVLLSAACFLLSDGLRRENAHCLSSLIIGI